MKLSVAPGSDGTTIPTVFPDNFYPIYRVELGVPIIENITGQSRNVTLSLLAERTHDESGNYTIQPFRVEVANALPSSVTLTDPILQNIADDLSDGIQDMETPVFGGEGLIFGNAGYDPSATPGGDQGTLLGGGITSFPLQSAIDRWLAQFRAFTEIPVTETDQANFAVHVNPGAAYVKGYKVSLNEKFVLTTPRARTTKTTTANIKIGAGLYFRMKDPVGGLFDVGQFEIVDLHLANTAIITAGSSDVGGILHSTKIGQGRAFDLIRKISNLSGGSQGDSEAEDVYYNLHMFDLRTTPISNAATGSTQTGLETPLKPGFVNAYVGGYIKMTSGPAINEVRRIVASNNVSGTINVTPAFSVAPTDPSGPNTFILTFNSSFLQSVKNTAPTLSGVRADVANIGKVGIESTGDTLLYGTNETESFFHLGHDVVGGVAQVDYVTTYYDTATSVSTEGAFFANRTGEEIQQNSPADFIFSIPSGTVLTATEVTKVDGGLHANGFVSTPTGLVGIIRSKVDVDLGEMKKSTPTALELANTVLWGVASSADLKTSRATGLVVIPNPNKISGGMDNLGIADVHSIRRIIDTGSIDTAPTNDDPVFLGTKAGHTDVTSRYALDTGQKASHYDYSSIVLKPLVAPPSGQLLVICKFYSHTPKPGTSNGYHIVDSYLAGTPFSDIPKHESQVYGKTRLSNIIDFRPIRVANSAIGAPAANTDIEVPFKNTGRMFRSETELNMGSVEYFLPRIDRLVVSSSGTGSFSLMSGVPSEFPAPEEVMTDDLMSIATLKIPAYTFNASDIVVERAINLRHKMSDINKLSRRVDRLEYFTSLNLLEKQAADMNIIDSTGAYTRFKNGILVDNFTGHGVENVESGDYGCSMDRALRELRPAYTMQQFRFDYDALNSQTARRTGQIVTLPYTEQTWVQQPFATRSISPNPFSLQSYLGGLVLQPSQDIWFETNTLVPIVYNLTGDNDNLEFLVRHLNENLPVETDWGAWSTTWLGVAEDVEVVFGTDSSTRWGDGRRLWEAETRTTTDTHFGVNTREGIQHEFTVENTTTSLGNRVVSSTIIPKMRGMGVFFKAERLEPNSKVYAIFDGTSVDEYIARANILELEGDGTSVPFIADGPWPDQAAAVGLFRPNGGLFQESIAVMASGEGNGTARVGAVTGNVVHIIVANGIFVPGDPLQGETFASGISSPTVNVASYRHYSGFCTAANNSHLTLEAAANVTLGFMDGDVTTIIDRRISIVSGDGAGQSRKISGFDAASYVATLDRDLTTAPLGLPYGSITASNRGNISAYSIGEGHDSGGTQTTRLLTPIEASSAGIAVGVFALPGNQFYTGEKLFKLSSHLEGDGAGQSTSAAEASYFAQGILQDVEGISVTTQSVGVASTSVTGQENISVDVSRTELTGTNIIVGYYDPLAQTFLVDANENPDGVFISSVDLWFEQKDDTTQEGITCEIRPTLNGFPSSNMILGTKTLYPTSIIVTTNPDPAAGIDHSRFTFPTPIYLEPGKEYAIVLRTNDIGDSGYLVWIAGNGEDKINFGATAGDTYKPIEALGTIFKSQNTTTWTENQDEDMMFRVNRCSFTTGSGIANFQNSIETGIYSQEGHTIILNESYNYDVLNIQSNHVRFPGTNISYDFSGKITGTDITSATTTIPANRDLYLDQRLHINSLAAGSLLVSATLETSDDKISPFIQVPGLHAITVQNFVDNASLSNTNFRIIDAGTDYAEGDSLLVTPNRTGSYPLGGLVIANNAQGEIIGIVANTQLTDPEGYDFFDNPAITISSGSGDGNAVIVFDGETGRSGGNVRARYSTREVILNEGFEAKDLAVFLTGHRPGGTDVKVYYKIKNIYDPDPFSNKNWVLMDMETTEASGTSGVGATNYWKELKFIPFTKEGEDFENPMKYTSELTNIEYPNFSSFAVKIVLSAKTTTQVPRVRALRAIALD